MLFKPYAPVLALLLLASACNAVPTDAANPLGNSKGVDPSSSTTDPNAKKDTTTAARLDYQVADRVAEELTNQGLDGAAFAASYKKEKAALHLATANDPTKDAAAAVNEVAKFAGKHGGASILSGVAKALNVAYKANAGDGIKALVGALAGNSLASDAASADKFAAVVGELGAAFCDAYTIDKSAKESAILFAGFVPLFENLSVPDAALMSGFARNAASWEFLAPTAIEIFGGTDEVAARVAAGAASIIAMSEGESTDGDASGQAIAYLTAGFKKSERELDLNAFTLAYAPPKYAPQAPESTKNFKEALNTALGKADAAFATFGLPPPTKPLVEGLKTALKDIVAKCDQLNKDGTLGLADVPTTTPAAANQPGANMPPVPATVDECAKLKKFAEQQPTLPGGQDGTQSSSNEPTAQGGNGTSAKMPPDAGGQTDGKAPQGGGPGSATTGGMPPDVAPKDGLAPSGAGPSGSIGPG